MDAYQKNFRRVVFTIGTLLALLFLLAFGPKLYAEWSGAPPHPARQANPDRAWEGQVMEATFLIFIAGYVVGWWRRLWGGSLMILAALVVAIPFLAAGNKGAFIFAIPEFIAGLLYLGLYQVERRQRDEEPTVTS